MLVVRSVVFNVLFYLSLIAYFFAAIPTLAMPRWGILAVARFWARSNLWLLRAVCGVKVEFRGVAKIPPGPLLVSCKHQSLWETFALLLILSDPAYIMKRELMWIPLFGWYAWKAGMIPVDRSRGGQALADMNARARQELARNRQIIIFPEGTRRSIRRYPGTIRVEVLDPIPPGLGKEAFFERLQHDVEAASARLLAEGEADFAKNAAADASLAPSP